MTITLILVLCAALALLFFLFRIKGYGATPLDESNLASRLPSVDLEAFRNLIDPDEEKFLRANLQPGNSGSFNGSVCAPLSTTSRVFRKMQLPCCNWAWPRAGVRTFVSPKQGDNSSTMPCVCDLRPYSPSANSTPGLCFRAQL